MVPARGHSHSHEERRLCVGLATAAQRPHGWWSVPVSSQLSGAIEQRPWGLGPLSFRQGDGTGRKQAACSQRTSAGAATRVLADAVSLLGAGQGLCCLGWVPTEVVLV